MSDAIGPNHFPRPALFVAGGPHDPPEASLYLRFEDQADGAVLIRDARDGAAIQTLPAGSNAFLRATLRGLTRQRLRESEGPEVPFRLTGWADHRLTLEDPVTHRAVELEAFGHSNAEVFAGILAAGTRPR